MVKKLTYQRPTLQPFNHTATNRYTYHLCPMLCAEKSSKNVQFQILKKMIPFLRMKITVGMEILGALRTSEVDPALLNLDFDVSLQKYKTVVGM